MPDFVPKWVADTLSYALLRVPDQTWKRPTPRPQQLSFFAATPLHTGDADMQVLALMTKHIFRCASASLSRTSSDLVPTFSAAKYVAGDYSNTHTDDQPQIYALDELYLLMELYGQPIPEWLAVDNPKDMESLCVFAPRIVAIIFYLTPTWDASRGGALIDEDHGGSKHAPSYDTLVAFRVPRNHRVEAVGPGEGMDRYSIFGWVMEVDRDSLALCSELRQSERATGIVTDDVDP